MFAYIEGKIQKEALYLQVTSMDGTKGKSGGGKRSQRPLAALTAAVCPRQKHTTPARVTKTSSST